VRRSQLFTAKLFFANAILAAAALALTATAALAQTSVSGPDLPDANKIIQAFTAKEGEFRRALNNYSFKRDALIQSIGMGGQVMGEYHRVSNFTFDDQGNRYAFGTAGTYDTSVKGIGIVSGQKADPQFTLAPGESRDVQFTVLRRVGREVAGTKLTYYVALVQLEILPSNQIRSVRQYSLTFPRMSGL